MPAADIAVTVEPAPSGAPYTVYPPPCLVMGVRVSGRICALTGGGAVPLQTAGITGLHAEPRTFQPSPDCVTVLVRLAPEAAARILRLRPGELAGRSVGLADLLPRAAADEIRERATAPGCGAAWLQAWLHARRRGAGGDGDRAVEHALRRIRASAGAIIPLVPQCGQVTYRVPIEWKVNMKVGALNGRPHRTR